VADTPFRSALFNSQCRPVRGWPRDTSRSVGQSQPGSDGKLSEDSRTTRRSEFRLSSPHEMTRTGTPEPGVEEWTCTTCARRLLQRRPPAFEKIVLERGDEGAAHVGGTGGLLVAAAEGMSALSRDLAAYDRAWLSEHGIDWRPGLGPEHPGDSGMPG
jgi:hypothetical protein